MVQKPPTVIQPLRPLAINGSYRWRTNPRVDERGSFCELYRDSWGSALGTKFVQCNISESKKNVLRGMHFQTKNPQGKLITVLSGAIIDLVVDLRKDSSSFEKFIAMPLGFGSCIYAPSGTAHGFIAIKDSTIMYQCTTPYDPETDSGINWLSPPWGEQIKEIAEAYSENTKQILSDKDRNLPHYNPKRVYFT